MNYAINLLPPHLRSQTCIGTKHMVAGTLIGVILFCGGLYGFQFLKEQQAKRELSHVSREIQLLQPVMQQIGKNKALKAEIDARIKLLSQLESERSIKWSDSILQLGQATPDNLWIIHLATDVNGGINIQGGADDIATVTQYADNLKQIPNVANVSFGGLGQADLNEKAGATSAKVPAVSGINIVMYELRVQFKGGVQK